MLFGLFLIALLSCERQTKPAIFNSQQTNFHLVPAAPLPKVSQRPDCYPNEKWNGWMCVNRAVIEYCARVAMHDYPNSDPDISEWQEYCIKMGYMKDN